jgi:hypothetical protein
MAAPEKIRVLAFREHDVWVAQCLEYDICAQGHDFEAALRRLAVVVNQQCRYTLEKHGEEFAGLDPAPAHFEKQFCELEQSVLHDNMELRLAA